jgi:hypothetical protein
VNLQTARLGVWQRSYILDSFNNVCRNTSDIGEFCERPGPFGTHLIDFSDLNPRLDRILLEKGLKRREYYVPETGDSELEYTAEEANYMANRYERFRLVIFSNFFTVGQTVERFEGPLTALFEDLNSGSIVVFLGATGNHYEDIYQRLSTIARNSGLRKLTDIDAILGRSSQSRNAQIVIKRCQHVVFQHLISIAGKQNLPEHRAIEGFYYRDFAEEMHLGLSKTIRWPDYWKATPYENKRLEFSLYSRVVPG